MKYIYKEAEKQKTAAVLFFFFSWRRKSVASIGDLSWIWIYREFAIWTNSYMAQLDQIEATKITGADKTYYCIYLWDTGFLDYSRVRGTSTLRTASVKLALMWQHWGDRGRKQSSRAKKGVSKNKSSGDLGEFGTVGLSPFILITLL